jgi:aspartate 1-decarboxylase
VSRRRSMQIHLLKSKIHLARVTEAALNYEGSITLAADLMERAGILPYERVLVGNMSNGQRFETYAIRGEPGSGAIILNGATARLGQPGDKLTIMTYAVVDAAAATGWKPRVIMLDGSNRVIKEQGI